MQDQLRAVIPPLFDCPVAVGVSDPRAPQPPVMAGEMAHGQRALASRVQEFAAGRAAARQAMAQLGLAPEAIPVAADRSPVWPEGLHGSISHCARLCAAVITTGPQSLGLDIEENTPLSEELLPLICSDAEQGRMAGPDLFWRAKLVFSAKEAAYKAQFPLTGMVFGFDHIDLNLDLPARAFTATFLRPAGCFAAGDGLAGRFDEIDGHLVTAAWADKSLLKGA